MTSRFDDSIREWNEGYRIVIICKKCNDEIYSRYSGQFLSCSCEAWFVDQTEYYCRAGGNQEHMDSKSVKFPELEENNE